jgi:uncharacterized protein (TIGR03083 family)
MPPAPKYDYKTLVRAELKNMSDFLHTLDPSEWEHQTLCEGWKVRHIVGHFVAGYSIPVPKTLWVLAKDYRFNFPKAAHEVSTSYGEKQSPTELMANFDKYTQRQKHIGIATLPPMSEHFLDHLIHQWDIQVPLNKVAPVSEERRRAALDTMVRARGITGLAPGRKLAQGLKLKATDLDWTFGEGPEVAGETRNLILALSGRKSGLAGLEGAGVEILRKRLDDR